MYVLLSGNVEISKTIEGKKVIIQTLQPEEVFGELVFLTEELNKLSAKFRYILSSIVNKLKQTTDVTCRLLAEK
jgi:CRP-like cAMP-binding protein